MLPLRIRARPKSEQAFVLVYIVLACFTLAHAVYLGYGAYAADVRTNHPGMTQQQYYQLHNSTALSGDHPFFQGMDHAPNQYRIGVEYAGKLIGDRIGIPKYYVLFSVFDFVCALAASLVCYAALIGSQFFDGLIESEKTLAVVALLLSLSYPFAWVVAWERPETLPSALYMSGCMVSIGLSLTNRWWILLVAALTLWQSFVRTDVPLALGLALLVLAFTRSAERLLGSKRTCFLLGVLVGATAIAVQCYLKFVRFPRATYAPDTDVVQLMLNLQPRRMITSLIAIAPWTVVLRLAMRYRKALDPSDLLAIVASCIYIPMWWTVGVNAEVRLFVPFLLALAPTTAKIMLLSLRYRPTSSILAGTPRSDERTS